MLVKDIMKKVVTIGEEQTTKEAASMMAEKGIGSLVVTGSKGVVGIVTERDILKHVARDADPLKTKVKDMMSAKIITIEPRKHIDEAATLMGKYKLKKLPVVENGKLLGIITSTDVVANSSEIDDVSFFD